MELDESKDISSELKRGILNIDTVNRFSLIKHVYERARQEDRLESEWQKLDEDTKNNHRECLNKR